MNCHKTMNEGTYMQKNGRWIYPLIAGIVIYSSAVLMTDIDPSYGRFALLSKIMCGIAFLVSGVYLVFTDTVTARVIVSIAQISALLLAIYVIWQHLFF